MPKKTQRPLKEFPVLSAMWLLLVRRLHAFVQNDDGLLVRPYAIIVLDSATGMPRKLDMQLTEPTPARVRDVLFSAIRQPLRGMGKPARPASVAVTDEALFQWLPGAFREQELEINLGLIDEPEQMNTLVRQMEIEMNDGHEPLPGYLSVPGVTPEQVGAVFAAAAAFYRAAPWVHFNNHQVIALKHPLEDDFRYLIVMGMGGVEYGLAVARSWHAIEEMFTSDERMTEHIPAGGYHSFAFDPEEGIPFDDLDAIDRYGWEIAASDAYPFAFSLFASDEMQRPSPRDLEWYEAALRALPLLVRDHLHSDGTGDYHPFETTLAVPTYAGVLDIAVKYPGGEIPRADMPVAPQIWLDSESDADTLELELPSLDRRAMERSLADLLGMMQNVESDADPALSQAQALMYQAWEEPNPGKRIALAHDALTLSENCADAWVLLAEEQADTLSRAAEYYQNGVLAGERALGSEFQELVGHFWGVMETRPYMRARAGLATALWQLNRKAEALEHYRVMLRLNPNDNQGIRDILLESLLQLERWDELGPLLQEYSEDFSAVWHYSRALERFHVEGASAAATALLRKALKQNAFVPPYLLGQKRVPNQMPEYIGVGDEAEAISYVGEHLNYWRREPGAVDWLRAEMNTPHKRSNPRGDTTRSGKPKRK